MAPALRVRRALTSLRILGVLRHADGLVASVQVQSGALHEGTVFRDSKGNCYRYEAAGGFVPMEAARRGIRSVQLRPLDVRGELEVGDELQSIEK